MRREGTPLGEAEFRAQGQRTRRCLGAENPSLSRLYYRGLWGSRNRRALILGWAYYLDAFSCYPLRTWLPSVYREHDNWANLRPARGNLCTPPLPFGRPTHHRNCIPETVPWPVGPDTRHLQALAGTCRHLQARSLTPAHFFSGATGRKAL
ncbi:hypothetical protein H6P81_021173 [Aristolochia fimbriata]|uniref:Uncharacterized protein n=1 Tax=Aristolochia fimbriata TaxID=158543 RepID=A0AAV7DQL4_ARIFI|nr:hypothetical protein H6P81_021173 [Aristolochia fimbriata]